MCLKATSLNKNMESNKLIAVLIISLIVAPLLSAEPSYIFKQFEEAELNLPCITNNEAPCSASILCNLTIIDPEGTILVDNNQMTYKSAGYYNFTLNSTQTSQLGEFSTSVSCVSATVNGFSTFNYLITPTGENRPTDGESRIIFLAILTVLALGLFFFWLGTHFESPLAKLIFIGIAAVMLFVSVMFTLNVVVENMAHLGSMVSGYSTFLLIVKTIVSLSVTILVLFSLWRAIMLWQVNRGLR